MGVEGERMGGAGKGGEGSGGETLEPGGMPPLFKSTHFGPSLFACEKRLYTAIVDKFLLKLLR